MNATLQILPEKLRWRSRQVRYYAGAWDEVLSVLPEFETVPFRAGPAEPSNPFLLTVSRKPLTALEHSMPVGIVSHRYSLVQHRDVAMRCREGLLDAGVDSENLRYEVGVSELGEWMNFRIYFPEEYSLQDSHGERVDLRLECFNAVDASSRLIVLFGWYRLVCANGMVIGESKIEIRERHGEPLDIDTIRERIATSLDAARANRRRLEQWQETPIDVEALPRWVDGPVTVSWGKKGSRPSVPHLPRWPRRGDRQLRGGRGQREAGSTTSSCSRFSTPCKYEVRRVASALIRRNRPKRCGRPSWQAGCHPSVAAEATDPEGSKPATVGTGPHRRFTATAARSFPSSSPAAGVATGCSG